MIDMFGNALENKKRRMIYNHILAYPGVSFGIMKKIFDIAESTLRYHLKYLEGADEIKSHLEGKIRCYYPIQNIIFYSRTESEFETVRLNPTQQRILENIQRNPGITQKGLLLETGLKRLTAAYNLSKLIEVGVVRKEPNGRNICYFYISNIELRKKILKKLIVRFVNHELDEQTFIVLKRKLDL
jgi:predicted transcriptional regulator